MQIRCSPATSVWNFAQCRQSSSCLRAPQAKAIREEAFMRTWLHNAWSHCSSVVFNGFGKLAAFSAVTLVATTGALAAKPESAAGGEANLKLPDLSSVNFLGGINGHKLLLWGILICIFGLLFGLMIFSRLKNMPVHRSMREISELIYETC